MLSHAALAEVAGRCYRDPWSGQAALDCEYDLLPRGDEELVVAIAGTHPDDPLDWIRDLRTLPWLFPTVGVCHSGFGSGGTAVAERVLAAVRGDARLMTVIGHSLGGAMALVVGARLIAAGRRVRIVTFGAPRVAFLANLALPRLAHGALELAEYRREGDPVPHVPTRPLFRHLTRGIAIGRSAATRSAITRLRSTPAISRRRAMNSHTLFSQPSNHSAGTSSALAIALSVSSVPLRRPNSMSLR